ncbi:bifunctional diguanylate cyclase/phosphodiesterase [Oceanicoccus sp. KOV_DT_Chl]|uniref:putative bifunctional diguanylate cyclase/phosphodiesterase n=1 Tax=Oceanicoccus sp. KOV_DT_Chl TaxID=1904639 RepID=UPI000C7AA28F|nr:EAL domain-containing protein [Oceanicoccus sp. KOV_DT_Chl]
MAVTGFWIISSNAIQNTFEQQAGQWMNKLDELSTPLYVSQDINEFTAIENYINNYSEVSYLKFYKADGVGVLAEYIASSSADLDVPVFNKSVFDDFTRTELKNGRAISNVITVQHSLMRMIAPVSIVSMRADEMLDFDMDDSAAESVEVIGYIDMGLDFSSHQSHLVDNIIKGSFFFAILFCIAAVIGRQLTTNALKPLLDLREPLNRLAQGDTDVWVSKNGDEEIVAISNALNATINAIKGRDAELRRLADYDALTGLINKRSFNNLLEQEKQRVVKEKDKSALFFIDLDQFKYVNDTLGHASGDRLLVQIAELLKKRMRTDDVVCRLGGDEFAVLAKSVDKSGAIEIANSIVKSMYDFLFIEQGKTFNIYCSVGAALIEADKQSAEEAFSNADMACYNAKSQGRNRFHLYEAQANDENKLDIGWSHRIAEALANDKFVLHYQPIVGVEEGGIPSYEALLRMIGEEGELVPPNLFIPVAERFGLATEIDYWVIRHSMKALEALNNEGRRVRFYVNLSGQLLVDPDFVNRVVRTFNEYDIDASQVVFELTERAAVGNIYNASQKMVRLQSYGFQFAVDDFGSGFSSFSYLKNMPVEYVKIEGEFVERILEDKIDRALVKSMVDIAKACGKKVVAEYVGDQETYDLLKSYGIDYAQGFFIAKPSADVVRGNTDPVLPENVTALKTHQG